MSFKVELEDGKTIEDLMNDPFIKAFLPKEARDKIITKHNEEVEE
jgi:hypothetical protein